MFGQVKAAAGIHMSTFKSKSDTDNPVENKDGTLAEEEQDTSNWSPAPHLLKAWTGGKGV